MKKFAAILRKNQEELKTYVANRMRSMCRPVVVGDGYVYSKGEIPIMLVAHLDTVHTSTPKEIFFEPQTGVLSSPQGIGGDDRCGVYMIFQIIQKYNCHVLFCEDEEIGAEGAKKFIKSKDCKELDLNYIIEFDRKGKNDAVFYDCDNLDFEDFITKEFYKTAYGSFSDISYLAPKIGCAAVNLSCGYYSPHTKDEYIVVSEMEDSIDAAMAIIERTTDEDKFEYIEAVYGYKKYSSLYSSMSYDYSVYYIIEYYDDKTQRMEWYDVTAKNEAEAVGIFCMNHPEIPYENIIDVCCDYDYM